MSLHLCEGIIKCNWQSEYLCGDKCIRNKQDCNCGQESYSFKERSYTTCCNGQRHYYKDPCNQECNQRSDYGYTMHLCEDKSQCYLGVLSCQGKPLCKE